MNPFFIPAFIFSLFLLVTPAAKASPEEASQFIEHLSSDVLAVVTDTKLDEKTKQDKLDTMFRKNVDVAWIGKFVLGKYWRTASEDQRVRYQQFYDPFLIHSYTSRFREYSGEVSETLDSKETRADEYVVSTRIVRPKAAPILVDYRVRKMDGKAAKPSYRVFDVIVEGVSLLATQRSEFGTVVSRDGLDSLIQQLENRASELEKNPSAAVGDSLLKSASLK